MANQITLKGDKNFAEASAQRENETGPQFSRRHRPTKSEDFFDEFARMAARGLPRRDILRMSLSGFAATALGILGVKPTWADVCSCNGQTYDSNTQCCTPNGVQNKYPVSDISNCPDRVPHPGYTPGFNGCGSEGSVVTPFIPNRFGLANFLNCCNNHDICYGTCGDNKDACDVRFLGCLSRECSFFRTVGGIGNDILYEDCLNIASVYVGVAHFGGSDAYNAAQSTACDCCPPQTCQGPCQYQCPCPSGPNAGKIFSTCAECLAACPSGLACFGYQYCTPVGTSCATCP
jgi:hypothetical protein